MEAPGLDIMNIMKMIGNGLQTATLNIKIGEQVSLIIIVEMKIVQC